MPKQPATFHCPLCPKRFTRAFNLQGHLRTHTDQRPFVCAICGKMFARKNDRKSHELLHTGEKKFVCKGDLANGQAGGCGASFARASNLTRHLRSKKGRACIKPLVSEGQSQLEVSASALAGVAGSPTAPEQFHQPPPTAQTSLYHDQSTLMALPTPGFSVFNEEQPSQPEQHAVEPVSTTAPPTLEEARKAAATVRRYASYHGLSNTEQDVLDQILNRPVPGSLVCPTCHQKVKTKSELRYFLSAVAPRVLLGICHTKKYVKETQAET